MVLTMTTPGTVIARHVRKELEERGYPLLEAEIAQRVMYYPELSMRGLSPCTVDPDGAAARDIARLAAEITNKAGKHHVVQAACEHFGQGDARHADGYHRSAQIHFGWRKERAGEVVTLNQPEPAPINPKKEPSKVKAAPQKAI